MTVRWHTPRTHEVDHERLWGWVLLASLAAVVAMVAVPDMRPVLLCPLKRGTGIPCPTCGMTRSLLALCEGEVLDALRLHPLTPPLALGAVLYVPYALIVSTAGSSRLRVSVSDVEAKAVRIAVVTTVALLWAFLIADGR